MANPHHKPSILQISIHVIAWTILGITIIQWMAGDLSANPIQAAEQRFGRIALYFLTASLACTPLVTLTGWREPIKRRRALGLYAFMFAVLHFFIFSVIDYGSDINQIAQLTEQKPFILLGITAGLILLALAITSFTWWMRQMGRGWQSLHRTVYLAALIVIIHYAMARKANILTLSGDILPPLVIGIIVILLLSLRIPFLRKSAARLRQKINAYIIHKSQT